MSSRTVHQGPRNLQLERVDHVAITTSFYHQDSFLHGKELEQRVIKKDSSLSYLLCSESSCQF